MGDLGRHHELLQAKRRLFARPNRQPDGDDKPNKKYYDPRVWQRAGEVGMVVRLEQAFQELNAVNSL